jgi:hypothetical protein
VWPFDHPFSTYTWPGPFGWVAHNCPGNVAAGFIQVAIAAAIGTIVYPPFRRWLASKLRPAVEPVLRHLDEHRKHMEWQAEHLARIAEATGAHVDPHPVDGILDRYNGS